MKKWLMEIRKPKAVVFVDYEHWFYSYKNIWGFQPNVSTWIKELNEKYRVVYIEFFADFSNSVILHEKAYLDSIADRVYDTQDELVRLSE